MNKLKEIFSRKDLIRAFVARDLKARYRGSVLGFLWSFIYPLSNAFVLWFIFTYVFTQSIPHFPLFLISGVVMWTFFQGGVVQATTSIISNGGIIKKIHLPREIFPISSILANFVNFLFAFIIIIILVIISHPPFNPIAWLFVPLILFLLIIFTIGLTLILSSGAVYFRDLPPLTESIMQIWYFATPIFYQLSRVPAKLTFIYMLNPMAAAITTFRQAIMEGRLPSFHLMLSLTLTAFFFLFIGLVVFNRLDKGIADEI